MEDFVPYELAVKLKEQGFDIPCIYAYCEQGGWNKYKQVREPITHILRTDSNPFGTFYCGKNWNIKYETNKNKIRCSAPTISQVLKWLREKLQIYISTKSYPCEDGLMWMYEVRKFSFVLVCVVANKTGFQEPEQAALAGIEYVIDKMCHLPKR